MTVPAALREMDKIELIRQADGKGLWLLISLSSRRREHLIAQMPTVKPGGREATDQFSVTTDLKRREGWSNRP